MQDCSFRKARRGVASTLHHVPSPKSAIGSVCPGTSTTPSQKALRCKCPIVRQDSSPERQRRDGSRLGRRCDQRYRWPGAAYASDTEAQRAQPLAQLQILAVVDGHREEGGTGLAESLVEGVRERSRPGEGRAPRRRTTVPTARTSFSVARSLRIASRSLQRSCLTRSMKFRAGLAALPRRRQARRNRGGARAARPGLVASRPAKGRFYFQING